MAPPAGYVLCATPRTGSTLLCGLLAETGRCGAPDSFFIRGMRSEWAEAWGLPDPAALTGRAHDRALLDAVIAAGKGGTPVFGLRLMHESLPDVSALLDRLFPDLPSDRARLEAAFGPLVFIHLSREDKLAQAVSLTKAEQTGLWHMAPDGSELERLAPPQAPVYDRARIAATLSGLEAHDAAWEAWFAREGVTPLRVGYETLAADPAATLARICASLDVAAPERVRPGVAKLADAVSAEWMRRFREQAG